MRLGFLRVALLLMVATGMPLYAQAQIVLDAVFDHGSLKSYLVRGITVTLEGRDNYAGSGNFIGSGKWRWLNFKATDVEGINPNFKISREFAGDATPGPHELTDHEMVYSYDGVNWPVARGSRRTGAQHSGARSLRLSHHQPGQRRARCE